ncbi:MAG: hypothetical protein M5R36_10875 [Deltaproteobacteria bacterium]|nr:hypothetical protein [Deltaproteobacteria bacterium]
MAEIRVVDIHDAKRGPREQLVDNIVRVLEVVLQDKAMARVLLTGATGVDPEFDHKVAEFYGHLHSLIKRSLKRGQAMNMLREIDVDLAASCVQGAIKEVIASAVDSGAENHRITEMADALLEYVAYGIFDRDILK